MTIDSHQHFWKFDPVRDSWIDESMSVIQLDFLPPDLYPILQENGISGCVTVQSDQSATENDFQLKNAEQHDFIKGVVGWVDLRAANVEEQLQQFKRFPKMKGFRHVLQGDADRALMLKPEFMKGIGLLNEYGFTYDILIFTDQINFSSQLAEAFPDQPFVLDHLAKPNIKAGIIDEWKKDIVKLASHQNVSCKVSGMVTEADWKNWKQDDFTSYLDVVFESFGTDRVMFGSDWPVCEVAGGYGKVVSIMKNYTAKLSQSENEKFWGGNASKFYGLSA